MNESSCVRVFVLKPTQPSFVGSTEGRVKLNPRYGTFDPQQGIVDAQPNWLAEKSASEAGLEEGHAPDDGHDH